MASQTVSVSVESGYLDHTHADALACTMASDMDLSKGETSAALLAKAGINLQYELDRKYQNKFELANIAVLNGHSLTCKYVFFGVLTSSDQIFTKVYRSKEDYYCLKIKDFMMACLKKAEEKCCRSIAFPAIGTGNLRYPILIVAEQMFQSVSMFISVYRPQHLRKVLFIIYPTDADVMQAFMIEEQRRNNMRQKMEDFSEQRTCNRKSFNDKTQQNHPTNNPVYDVLATTARAIETTAAVTRSRATRATATTSNTTTAASLVTATVEKPMAATTRATKATSATSRKTTNVNVVQFPLKLTAFVLLKFFYVDLLNKYEYQIDEMGYLNVECPNIAMRKYILNDFECALKEIEKLEHDQLSFETVAQCDILNIDSYFHRKVCCIVDQESKVVHLYGKERSDVQNAMEQCQAITKKSERISLRNQNQLAEIESQEMMLKGNEMTDRAKHNNKTETQRQFSWSKHSKLCETFNTADNILVKVYCADILTVPVDCIVNNANIEKSGVALAIAKAAGKDLVDDMENYIKKCKGKLKLGHAFATRPGCLPFCCVIHVVGPHWDDYRPNKQEDNKCLNDLYMAILNSLYHAEVLKIKSVAITALSSDTDICPFDLCSQQYASAVFDYRRTSSHHLEEIHFVDINEERVIAIQDAFRNECKKRKPHEKNCYSQKDVDSTKIESEKDTWTGGTASHEKHSSKEYSSSKYASNDHPKKSDKMTTTYSQTESYNTNGEQHVEYPYWKIVRLTHINEAFTCCLGQNQKLFIYTKSLLELNEIDMAVCSEGVNGNGTGGLTKQLSKIGGPLFLKAKESAFKNRNFGDVIIVPYSNQFHFVAYTVLFPDKDHGGQQKRKQKVDGIFSTIWELMKQYNLHSVALPMLGTGKAHGDPVYYGQIFINSLVEFVKLNAYYQFVVHLVDRDQSKTHVAVNVMKDFVDNCHAEILKPIQSENVPNRWSPEENRFVKDITIESERELVGDIDRNASSDQVSGKKRQLTENDKTISSKQDMTTTALERVLPEDVHKYGDGTIGSSNNLKQNFTNDQIVEQNENTAHKDTRRFDNRINSDKVVKTPSRDMNKHSSSILFSSGTKMQIYDDDHRAMHLSNLVKSLMTSSSRELSELGYNVREGTIGSVSNQVQDVPIDSFIEENPGGLNHKDTTKRSDGSNSDYDDRDDDKYRNVVSKMATSLPAVKPKEVESCVICMETIKDETKLKCGHKFCSSCIEAQFTYKQACPTCGHVCGLITGDQPYGEMCVYWNKDAHCAGFELDNRIEITYSFPSGTQMANHPNPGKRYKGIIRTAYLPNNKQGKLVLEMLKVAFSRKLVFTIGKSRTTGHEDVITWNDIHHKTDPMPNTQFGYPDPTYLDRVTDELAAKGVTPEDIPSINSK